MWEAWKVWPLPLSFSTRWKGLCTSVSSSFFWLPLKKARLKTLSLSSFHSACLSPAISVFLSLFLSLVSSDTLVSLRVEEQRDSAMGLLEEMERRREEKWGERQKREEGGGEEERGLVRKRKKNLSIQMLKRKVNTELNSIHTLAYKPSYLA